MAGVTMRPLLLCMLASCYADSALSKGGDTAGGATDTGGYTDGDSALDSADTGETLLPVWYTVSARLTVAGGAAVADAAEVTVIVVAEDAVTTVCEVPLDTQALAVAASPVDEVSWWWELPVTPLASACAELPATLGLGIGELGADALARLGTVGLDDVASSLFGAYLREGEGDVYIYGWAGTEGDLMGDTTAKLPPPDGEYTLSPLYLLALP